ncbi:hypothetical protein BJ742DRAFT_10714 [Cladochytrium replicatum]|nr:hypothetical protein BJ742DRAFT_10714 [Cladochytrium replicatum]
MAGVPAPVSLMLRSINLDVREDWIAAAVEESTRLGNIRPGQLVDFVRRKLLNTNLAQTAKRPGTLTSFARNPKGFNATLQVASIEEISISAQSLLDIVTVARVTRRKRFERILQIRAQTGVRMEDAERQLVVEESAGIIGWAEMNPMQRKAAVELKALEKTLPRGLLKLSLTDGVVNIVAMELVPLPGLSLLSPNGVKILLKSPINKNGILFFAPGTAQVLGGSIPDFENNSPVDRLETALRLRLGLPLDEENPAVDERDPWDLPQNDNFSNPQIQPNHYQISAPPPAQQRLQHPQAPPNRKLQLANHNNLPPRHPVDDEPILLDDDDDWMLTALESNEALLDDYAPLPPREPDHAHFSDADLMEEEFDWGEEIDLTLIDDVPRQMEKKNAQVASALPPAAVPGSRKRPAEDHSIIVLDSDEEMY